MLFAIPGLAEVLLSHEAITMSLAMHYTATWSGYVLCAFADGLAVTFSRSRAASEVALLVAFVASILTSRYASPIDPAFALYRVLRPKTGSEKRAWPSFPETRASEPVDGSSVISA